VINNVIVQREWSARFDGAQKTWGPIVEITPDVVCSRRIATDATGDLAYAGWMACNGGPARVRWKKFTTANGWDADPTEIPSGDNIDAAGTPPFEDVELNPDGTALFVYRRNQNADDAVLVAHLP
jgi:hypothetical protein